MSDLIRRQDAIDAVHKQLDGCTIEGEGWVVADEIEDVIEQLPSADRPSIVRCKDCKHRVYTEDGESNPHDIVCDYHMSDGFDETDFCSYGERREP